MAIRSQSVSSRSDYLRRVTSCCGGVRAYIHLATQATGKALLVPSTKAIKEEQAIKQFDERSFLWGGRLRIPCGSGYVTLPAMAGVG